MDSAIQVVNMAGAVQVSAQYVNDRFHGEVPASVRFYCPFCSRPVTARAMGWDFDRRRRNHVPRTRSPHFAHHQNDDWAKNCEAYHAGAGTVREEMTLPLLMFLRRGPGTKACFRVEIALRRRGLASAPSRLTSEDTITVDDRSYSLRELLADRRNTITLSDPLSRLEFRIRIPAQWRKNVGCVQQSTGIMVFSDSFGPNGGRRLPERSALRCDCTYYIVASERRMKGAVSRFDRVERIGNIAGNDRLHVYAVSVSGASLRKNAVDDWLSQYGYCLSDVDRAAQLMWPPSLRSWGVDEPLFRDSSPTYRFPYRLNDRPMRDVIASKRLHKDTRAREVGLIGFDRHDAIEKQTDWFCAFFKPQRRMPWTTVYLGPRHPEDLHPYDEWTETEEEQAVTDGSDACTAKPPAQDTDSADREVFDGAAPPLPLTCGSDIASQRRGLRMSASLPSRSIAIARLRERTR